MTGKKRFASQLPLIPILGRIPSPEELRRQDAARAAAMYPFPMADISHRRYEMWVCKLPPPGHDPCTCWPQGCPTIEDAIQDLTLEQLGVKGKKEAGGGAW